MIASSPNTTDSPLVSWPNIPGYKLLERLYENERTVIYRAIQTDTIGDAPLKAQGEAQTEVEQTVIIKLLSKSIAGFEEIARFRNQAVITGLLYIPGIAQVYALSEYKQRPMIIMEDFGGLSLDRYVQQQRTESAWEMAVQPLSASSQLPLQQFLSVALQIADILAAVHKKNVIHKDIKPQNILIHPPSGRVQIIDFSLSSQLPREQQGIHPPEAIEGSWPLSSS
ncbi:MAG: protein kinase [Cyanobacteria bacterium J06649_4]